MGLLRRLLGGQSDKKKPDSRPRPSPTAGEYQARQKRAAAAASYKGRHYTEWVDDVKDLKRTGALPEAEVLLLHLIDAVEAEAEVYDWRRSIAPGYYENLAIVYRKQKRYGEEVGVLDRYAAATRRNSEASGRAWTGDRLSIDRREKAVALLEKHRAQADRDDHS